MIVKGRRTVVDQVDVEVSVREIIGKLYDMSAPDGLAYIGDDGFWYKETGFDYHKREELYDRDRQATEEELEMKKAYRTFMKFIREKNL